jgi:hypothetical protein
MGWDGEVAARIDGGGEGAFERWVEAVQARSGEGLPDEGGQSVYVT